MTGEDTTASDLVGKRQIRVHSKYYSEMTPLILYNGRPKDTTKGTYLPEEIPSP